MAEKACRVCNYLTEGKKCPACGSDNLSSKWKGEIIISDSKKSEAAKKLGIGKPGKYALAVD